MNWIKTLISIFIVLFGQFFLSGILEINTVRPDFPVIFIMYTAIRNGRFHGIVIGFFIGILVDLSGVSSYFGLSSLTYVVTAYLSGYLQMKSDRLDSVYYMVSWIGILAIHFLIFTVVRYQILLPEYHFLFLIKWISTTAYTLGFMLIFQFIYNINPNKY